MLEHSRRRTVSRLFLVRGATPFRHDLPHLSDFFSTLIEYVNISSLLSTKITTMPFITLFAIASSRPARSSLLPSYRPLFLDHVDVGRFDYPGFRLSEAWYPWLDSDWSLLLNPFDRDLVSLRVLLPFLNTSIELQYAITQKATPLAFPPIGLTFDLLEVDVGGGCGFIFARKHQLWNCRLQRLTVCGASL